jgi:hypothetical protein
VFGAAVAYDEVKYKYTDLQSLVANSFALERVLHKAYDEIRDRINHNDAVACTQ